jgi:choline dehydrogenase-like flavoprotein
MSRVDSLFSPGDGRAALAVAQTLIPGTAHIPAADEALVAGVEALVREISPALVRPWFLAQRLLAQAARARARKPLDALSAVQREEVLRHWERNKALRLPLSLVSILYKAVHFDSARVYGALRERPESPVALESPRWLEQVRSAEAGLPEEGDVECDAVVVGTGAGGAVVGRELADRGYAVVFVERGEHYRRDAFDGSAVGAHRRFYSIAASVGNAVIPIMAGRLVGGSSAVNGGTCFRTPRWILDRWCEELGTEVFAPERMEPLFERVEAITSVAPARQPEIGPIEGVFVRGCQALGWSHAPVRRNVDGCDGKGFCDFGCRTDARRSTNLSYIPAALEKGAVLFTGLRADRVLVQSRRAVGLEAVSKSGRRLRVRARAVVLAGGALPTPLFLLKQGLCNRSGQVGRNLTLHPSTGVGALMDDEICGWQHIPQGYGCDQFLRQGELIIASQPDVNVAPQVFPLAGRRLMETLESLSHIAYAGLMVRDSTSAGRVWFEAGGKAAISYSVSPEDRDALHSVMMHAIDLFVAAGAKRLYPARHSSPILELGEVDRFRRSIPAPSDFALISYHPLGTCRMGKDPRKSVVGLDHQAHDLHGLFIVDGSTVPSAPGVNPQLTIMAMATRAAERIGDALG